MHSLVRGPIRRFSFSMTAGRLVATNEVGLTDGGCTQSDDSFSLPERCVRVTVRERRGDDPERHVQPWPMGVDVLQDLVDSKHLDQQFIAAMPTHTVQTYNARGALHVKRLRVGSSPTAAIRSA